MEIQRKYGVGGYIHFSEWEIESMYYTLKWMHTVMLHQETKDGIQEVINKIEPEMNLSGVLQ